MADLKSILFFLVLLRCFLLVEGADSHNHTVLMPKPDYLSEGNYVIIFENVTATFEMRFYNLPGEVEVKWGVLLKDGMKKPGIIQVVHNVKRNALRTLLTVKMTKDVVQIVCNLIYLEDKRTSTYGIPFKIRTPTPVKMDVIGDIEVVKGVNHVIDNQNVSLLCYGGGIENFTITWLDGKGLPVQSSNTVRIGDLVEHQPKEKHRSGSRRLDFTVERGMTAFGCQLMQKYVEYPLIKWFNFTVPLTATVITQSTSSTGYCGHNITLNCQTNVQNTKSIEYQWALSGSRTRIGGQNLTINSAGTEVEYVRCSVRDQFGSAFSEMEIFEFPDCSLDWVRILAVLGGVTLSVFAAILTRTEVFRR